MANLVVSGKKSKLNMITSTVANKYAVMRSFGSSSVSDLSSFFFWKTKYFFLGHKNLTLLQLSFESYSELVSYSLEIPNESTLEKSSANELEQPSNIPSAGRCDNYNINYYSGKSTKIVKNSNSDSN